MEKRYTEVQRSGVSCYTDAAIFDADSKELYFISLFGRPGTVKAIGAIILQGMSVRLLGNAVGSPSMGSMRMFTQNLGGLCHKVILSPEYFVDSATLGYKILVGKDKVRAFQFLDSVVSTPLKPDWADVLWEKVFEPKPLTGFGFFEDKDLSEAYLVRIDKSCEEVDDLVLEGLKTGELN